MTGVWHTMASAHQHTNKLIEEESPYLQQHAHNPVAWYPWGEEAFKKAIHEDKLIFLSIGYSTCHWCHVMERESFENEEVADFMNRHYVNIKVDREELPHIDRYFQDVYMLLNKRAGGWPLTIIMTPDRKPFYAATYLPPKNRYGRAGLLGMAQYLCETFREKRDNVYKSADSVVAAMQNLTTPQVKRRVAPPNASRLSGRFVKGVTRNYDPIHKGIGDAPKFPHATTLQTLLDIYRLTSDKKALKLAVDALEAMARGGIYDQIEGGFYRYSVDAMWLIPHFEKMLYTNAELIACYSDAWQVTQKALFAKVVRESVENMDARFLKEGLYYSASDAESDAEEGKYFIFGYDEAKEALLRNSFSQRDAEEVLAYYHIIPAGNFEGRNNPAVTDAPVPKRLEEARTILRAVRSQKHYPFIDYKIQTSWNALMIYGLFKASVIEPAYAKRAKERLDTLLGKLYIDGRLYHQIVLPNKPKIEGYLEDYAFLVSALIEAYQTHFERAYLDLAAALFHTAERKFHKKGKWLMSEDAFTSEATLYDTSYRSAPAVMLENGLKLSHLHEDTKEYAAVRAEIMSVAAELAEEPQNFPTLTGVRLQEQYGWTLLKAPSGLLLREEEKLHGIRYPYLLLKPSECEEIVACKMERCFAHAKNIEDIVEKIE